MKKYEQLECYTLGGYSDMSPASDGDWCDVEDVNDLIADLEALACQPSAPGVLPAGSTWNSVDTDDYMEIIANHKRGE